MGVRALLLGVLVYVLDRSPGHSLLITVAGALNRGPSIGAWANWLHSFFHPLAFGLFTTAVLPTRYMPRRILLETAVTSRPTASMPKSLRQSPLYRP